MELNKLWAATGNSVKNPVLIDILKIQRVVPNILPGYFHLNPTLQINGPDITLFWRVSNNELTLDFDKKGRPITELGERISSTDFENIISGNLHINFDTESEIVIPSNQSVLPHLHVKNLDAIIKEKDLPSRSFFIEDPRAHKENGRYLTAIIRFGELKKNKGLFSTRIVLIDTHDLSATVITSDSDRNIEKNWIVVQELDNSLTMLQHSNPQVLVSVDISNGKAEALLKRASYFVAEPENVSGGTPFLLIDNSFYLRVARLQFTLGSLGRIRINLLVMHDLEFREISRSTPFVFQELGVEICNGLALNGDRVYFTWGKNDREMFIGSCLKNDLLSWYESHKQA